MYRCVLVLTILTYSAARRVRLGYGNSKASDVDSITELMRATMANPSFHAEAKRIFGQADESFQEREKKVVAEIAKASSGTAASLAEVANSGSRRELDDVKVGASLKPQALAERMQTMLDSPDLLERLHRELKELAASAPFGDLLEHLLEAASALYVDEVPAAMMDQNFKEELAEPAQNINQEASKTYSLLETNLADTQSSTKKDIRGALTTLAVFLLALNPAEGFALSARAPGRRFSLGLPTSGIVSGRSRAPLMSLTHGEDASIPDAKPPMENDRTMTAATPALPTAEDIEAAPFMDAVSLATTVCEALQSGDEATKAAATALIPSFLGGSDGARGWFVSSLSDPTFRDAALDPSVPRAIVDAVPSKADPTFDLPRLMVMNVLMPRATANALESAGNADQAKASLETFDRAYEVLTATAGEKGSATVTSMLKEDLTAVAAAAGGYAGGNMQKRAFWMQFMDKWGYSQADKQVIQAVASDLLKSL